MDWLRVYVGGEGVAHRKPRDRGGSRALFIVAVACGVPGRGGRAFGRVVEWGRLPVVGVGVETG
jgi:hypothetical protein